MEERAVELHGPVGGLRGRALTEQDAATEAELLAAAVDPGNALRTLHWGRNYLYTVGWPGRGEVVVKQFRPRGRLDHWRSRRRGTRARRSYRIARSLLAAGVATPAPVAYLEAGEDDGTSYYLCDFLEDALECRYLIRALERGTEHREFPEIDVEDLFRRIGGLARRLHDAGVLHRDFSMGNLLVPRTGTGRGEVHLVDLNRARLGARPGLWRRMRDVCRLPLPTTPAHRGFFDGYFGSAAGTRARLGAAAFGLCQWAFQLRNRSKSGARSLGRRLQDLLLPRRRPHAHIPPAAPGASAREKTVWDPLSDQPHQHAGRWEKLRVRMADAPEHLSFSRAALAIWSRARRRADELRRDPFSGGARFEGLGVCVRPHPGGEQVVLEHLGALTARDVLLRVHVWDEAGREAELRLARALAAEGFRVAFALAQDRSLAAAPERWSAAVATVAESFTPFGRHFVVGQAINRSKWGIWRPAEYVELLRRASGALRSARPDVEILGPGVIDFEPFATAGYLQAERQGLAFDATAHLLYVDRRGAPENEQLGYDAVGKLALLRALAEAGRNARSERCWITEFNWPLWEGPHSPAGRDVAVSEERQAQYLVRYAILLLATGWAERIFWWQLVAKGYGLVDPSAESGERRRPAFEAFRRLLTELGGAVCLGALGVAGERDRLLRFRRTDGSVVVVGWTLGAPETADEGAARSKVELPQRVAAARDHLGADLGVDGRRVELAGSPRYFDLES